MNEFDFSNLFSIEKFIDIVSTYKHFFIEGFIYTILLAFASVLCGFVIALFINSLRMSKFRGFRWIGIVYIEITRGTPLLVQLSIIYYGLFTYIEAFITLPKGLIFGFINPAVFIPGVITVALNSGAYVAEIIRAGIQAVDGGQTEAARSLGMTEKQTMKLIIMPQAIKNILPALANEFVVIIKESSICSVIGLQELMFKATQVRGATFRTMEPLMMAAILYLLLTIPTSKIIAHVERRMSRGDKR